MVTGCRVAMAVMLRTVVVFAIVGQCVCQITTTPAPVIVNATPDAIGKLNASSAIGATAIVVTSVAGFVQGRQIAIGNMLTGATEDATIASIVPNPPSFNLAAGLTKAHLNGTAVVMHKIPAASPADSGKCKLTVPDSCKLPFNYKGVVYSTCTGTDAMSTLWCSEDSNYQGRWKACTDPCKGKWPVKKIVGSVVAGGIAATGIGLTAAAMANSAKNGHFNPFYHGEKGQIKGKGGGAVVHTTGAPHLIQHDGGYDVWGEMVDVTAAPARRLGQSLPGGSVDLTATGTFGDVFAFIAMAVFLFGGIYSIRRLAAKKNNQKESVAPEESNTPYVQA